MGCLRYCLNKIIGTILFFGIIILIIYLFYTYPPWFSHIIDNIKKAVR